MSIVTKIIYGSLLLTLLSCNQANDVFHAKTSNELNEFVHSMVEQFNLPGVAVLLTRGDSIFFQKSYGYSNFDTKESLSDQHNFHFASVAKTFVAMGIMQLVDEGKLSIDQKVIEILPYFKMQGNDFKYITVAQLLNHSSGMGDVDDYGWDAPKYEESELENFIRSFEKDSLLFTPGTAWSYSNNGYAVLAHIIAKLSGSSFEDYMEANIFEPLNMNQTTFFYPNTNRNLRSSPHSWNGKIFVSSVYPYNRKHAGSSTLNTCLEDMAKYTMYHLSMYQQRDSALLTMKSHRTLWNKSIAIENAPNIGLSWFLGTHRETKSIWHGGRDLGFTSYVVLLPDEDVSVIVASNYQLAPIDWIANGMLDIIMGFEPFHYSRHIGFELYEKYLVSGTREALNFYRTLEADSARAAKYIMGADGIIPLVNFCKNNTSKDTAKKLAELNIELHPQSTEALNNYGVVLLDLDSLSKAEEIFQRVLNIEKQNEFAQSKIMSIHKKR